MSRGGSRPPRLTAIGRLVFRLLALKFERRVAGVHVHDVGNVPAGPVVLASRHLIDQEYHCLVGAVRRPVRFVANIRRPKDNSSYFDPHHGSKVHTWLAQKIFWALTVHDIRPGELPRSFLRQFTEAMQAGHCVLIFPEGTVFVERNTEWGGFERGALVAVHHAERAIGRTQGVKTYSIPIVPVGISYEWTSVDDPSRGRRKPHLHFRFGRPLTLAALTGCSAAQSWEARGPHPRSLGSGHKPLDLRGAQGVR